MNIHLKLRKDTTDNIRIFMSQSGIHGETEL